MAQPREQLPHRGRRPARGGVGRHVSRVLSGSPRVGGEARARVLAVTTRFDYEPSRLARHLRSGRADVVGVVIPDIENAHFATMVRAVEDAMYGRGRRILLCNTTDDAPKQSAYLRVLAAERVLGVLLSSCYADDPEIADLLDLGIPVVAFDRSVTDRRADSVTVENQGPRGVPPKTSWSGSATAASASSPGFPGWRPPTSASPAISAAWPAPGRRHG